MEAEKNEPKKETEPEKVVVTENKEDKTKKEEEKNMLKEKPKKTWVRTLLTFLGMIVLFGLAFQFQARMGELGPVDDIGERTKEIFEKYYLLSGLVFGFLSGLLFLILNLFSRLVKKGKFFFYFIVVGLSILPWYLLARQFVFNEARIADYAKGIISYIGFPLLATTKFLFILLIIYFVISIIAKYKDIKSVFRFLLVLVIPVSLSGCIGGAAGLTCFLLPDSDHCYQAAAMQENDPEGCAKIKGEGFEGSNPPRDKCYLKIATNTGDLSICDKIEGGMFSYSKEECYLDASIEHVNPSGCMKLSGVDKETCVNSMADKITSGSVIEIDEQIKVLQEELKNNPDSGLQKQLEGLMTKRNDSLEVMSEKNKKEYEEIADPRNQDAALDYHLGKIDLKTKDSLIALNNVLRDKKLSMSEKEYKAMRDMLAYKNDPKNNVENMDDKEIVKLRWNEKLGNATEFFKFWKGNKTKTEEKYDEQLHFYQRMLERQAAIDKGLSEKQQDFNRNADALKEYAKNKVIDTVMDEAKKAAFGELLDLVDSSAAGPVTSVLGEAIEVVKAEAKSKEFRGLVRAYNKGMQEAIANSGGNVEKAHEEVVSNLQKNPYIYEDQNTFAKYGNLLENPDCDGKNPHCLDKKMFWKAMKKSYKYQNK